MGTPVTTRYFMTTDISAGTNFGFLSPVSPINATTVFGWRMGNQTAPRWAQKHYNTEVSNTVAAGWTTTPTSSLPNPTRGDGWIMGPFNGIFNSGSWQVTMSLRSVTNSSTQLGRLNYKVWRTPSPTNQSTHVPISQNWESSSQTVTLATTNNQNRVSASFDLPEIRLQNEYLIFQELFWLTVAGGNSNADADWSYGTSAAGNTSASVLPTSFTSQPPIFTNWIQDEFPET